MTLFCSCSLCVGVFGLRVDVKVALLPDFSRAPFAIFYTPKVSHTDVSEERS